MRKHPATSSSHPDVALKYKAGFYHKTQIYHGEVRKNKNLMQNKTGRKRYCLPQQLGCLQVADTGATPPAPVTPPSQEVPGRTSSSSLPKTHRDQTLWTFISKNRLLHISMRFKCQGAREVYPPVSLQINPPAGDGSEIDRMRSVAL